MKAGQGRIVGSASDSNPPPDREAPLTRRYQADHGLDVTGAGGEVGLVDRAGGGLGHGPQGRAVQGLSVACGRRLGRGGLLHRQIGQLRCPGLRNRS